MFASGISSAANTFATRAVAAQPEAAPAAATKPAANVIEMHTTIVAPQAEIVVQANATTQANDARYDNRVTGATENVRSFDRMGNITKGFEHLREIFDNMREESAASEKSREALNLDAPISESIDVRV